MSVFVLCDAKMNAVGTAFVVSKTKVITAYHNVGSMKKHYGKIWNIVSGLERNENGVVTVFGDVNLKVKIAKFNRKSDWALLCRCDESEFSPLQIVEICTNGNVPEDHQEAKIKIYHCPVALFNSELLPLLKPVSVSSRVSMTSTHSVFFEQGLFAGSSGALVVLSNGIAIGMHLEAISSSVSFADLRPAHEDEGKPVEETLTEVTDSCVECVGTFSRAIILPRFAILMKAISS